MLAYYICIYYADDTALLASAKQSNTVIKTFIFDKWRIKVNCEKTQAILVSAANVQRSSHTMDYRCDIFWHEN